LTWEYRARPKQTLGLAVFQHNRAVILRGKKNDGNQRLFRIILWVDFELHAMSGLWVALAIKKTVAEIRTVLENWFPELVVTDWDTSSVERGKESLKNPLTETADILFQVFYNKSEFPTGIHLDRFPGPQDEAVIMPTMIELARLFSTAFTCRTICDGSGYGDDESPYWDIIWDKGKSYLADDCDTKFGDLTGGVIKIVREITLPAFVLDDAGQLIG
jgi:hypothetical protein